MKEANRSGKPDYGMDAGLYEEMTRCMTRMFNRYSELSKRSYEYCKGAKLYPNEIKTLKYIQISSTTNFTDIASQAGLTRSAVSKMIVKLEKMGLVERYRYYPNQREVYVHLTDRGVDACDGYDRYHDEMNRRLRQYFGSLRTDQKMDILAFLYYYINEQKCLPE